jgi:hypothetical protein
MVISDPAKDRTRVLIVNMTTFAPYKDQSCLLNPGDHPQVLHNSVVYYAGSRVYSDAHLNSLVASGKVVSHETLSAEMLKLVRGGALDSPHMRLDHGQILIEQGLVD